MRSLFLSSLLLLVSLLAACAGVPFQPGVSSGDDVLRQWGAPAQRWSEPDGSQRLAYPWGPMGFATWMVEVGPDGKVRSATNVLVEEEFAKVQAGQTQEEILRHFGRPGWVQQFDRRQDGAFYAEFLNRLLYIGNAVERRCLAAFQDPHKFPCFREKGGDGLRPVCGAHPPDGRAARFRRGVSCNDGDELFKLQDPEGMFVHKKNQGAPVSVSMAPCSAPL